jgi:hypothetical protein
MSRKTKEWARKEAEKMVEEDQDQEPEHVQEE